MTKPVRPNRQRGDATLTVGDKKYTLRLTLGAMADIEDALGVPISKIGEKMQEPSIKDLISVVKAFIHAGGSEITDEEMRGWSIGLDQIMKAVNDCFERSGFGEEEDKKSGE